MAPRPLLVFGFSFLLIAAAPPISFTPVERSFAREAGEYRRLWDSEGLRIVAALEAATGLAFPPIPIDAIVSEGRPMAAYDGRTIRLRAGYPTDYKKATLIHEMGHRIAFTFARGDGLDDHRLLYLFLYDVWTDLYGRDFAEGASRIERGIPGDYDYDAAWSWALAMTREERQARLAALRKYPSSAGVPEESRQVLPISHRAIVRRKSR